MTLDVDSILEELDVPCSITKETQVKCDLMSILACNTSNIPVISAAARDHNVFAHLSVKGYGLIPDSRDSCNQLCTFLLLLIMLRSITEHIERRFKDHIHTKLVATCSLAYRIDIAR